MSIYTKQNCMPEVLKRFPSFNKQWQAYLDEWAPEATPGLCSDILEFSDYVLELLRDRYH